MKLKTLPKPGIYLDDSYARVCKLPSHSIDLVIMDPPYEVSTKGGGSYGSKVKHHFSEISGISSGFDLSILDELCRVMKKINIYIWCSLKQIPILLDYFVRGKVCNFNILSWHKTNPVPACGNKYLSDTEYCLFFREKGVKVYGSYATKLTYRVTPKNDEDKHRYGHPTIKPLSIIEDLIINSSLEGDIILDPFSGSGTVYVASQKLNRRCIAFEIDEDYYNISIKRASVDQ